MLRKLMGKGLFMLLIMSAVNMAAGFDCVRCALSFGCVTRKMGISYVV